MAIKLKNLNPAVFSNNVGIGTTAPSSDAIARFLHLNNALSAGIVLQGVRKFSVYSSSSSSLVIRDEAAAATRFVMDSIGNVGIGTTSPGYKLHVVPNIADYGFVLQNLHASSYGAYIRGGKADGTTTALDVVNTAGTALMSVLGSGNVCIGTTFPKYTSKLTIVRGTNSYNITSSVTQTSSSGHIVFENNDVAAVGTIFTSGSTTQYNTTSDYRLKENIAPMTGALAKVAALKPCTYKWKVDGSDGQGFIAHELQAVVPDCVTGTKDDVNEDGSIKPQGVDASFLVATLTAAIQELKAIIDTQNARIEALEGVN